MVNENNNIEKLRAMLQVYMGTFDYCYQFHAIKEFLEHSQGYIQKQKEAVNAIEAANADVEYGDYVIAEEYHKSMYWDAAYSMAAVGQLAPFLESLMTDYFLGLGRIYDKSTFKSNRFERVKGYSWDPHFYFGKDKVRADFCDGLKQLIEDLDIRSKLPEDTIKIFKALMLYRNRMFHNGIEWPEEQRKNFRDYIQKHKMEHWFSYSISGNDPWIYYMEKTFIDECLKLAEFLINNLGGVGPAQKNKVIKTK